MKALTFFFQKETPFFQGVIGAVISLTDSRSV